MKKMFYLIAALMMVSLFSACGNKKAQSQEEVVPVDSITVEVVEETVDSVLVEEPVQESAE